MALAIRSFSRTSASIIIFLLFFPTHQAMAQHGDGCACGRPSSTPVSFELDLVSSGWNNAAITELRKINNYSNIVSWSSGDNVSGRNNKNEIVFFTPQQAQTVYGYSIDSSTFGFAYLNPQSAFGTPSFNECPAPAGTTCGVFSEVDVIMNASFGRGWTTGAPNYNDTGPAYFGTTALHEFGHTLGIHHNFDSLSTMNYYEDFAGLYFSRGDANILRVHYPGNVRAVKDISTFPFRFSGYKYSGTTVASASPSSVQQGGQLTLKNFTVENIGSTPISNVRLHVYLSTNSTVTTSDYKIGTLAWNNFSTWWDDGSSGRLFTVPVSVPPGNYFIGAIAFVDTNDTDVVGYNNSWVLDSSRKITVTQLPQSLCDGKVVTVNLGQGEAPTQFSDVILGTSANDVINALGGNDTVCSGGGADTVTGGSGDDRIFGDGGDDILYGNSGRDSVYGGLGNDKLYGNTDDDRLYGDSGNDELYGGHNDDLIYGGSDADQIFGGNGDDELYGQGGSDRISGDEGNDTIEGNGGSDVLNGGDGNDSIDGGSKNDLIYGGRGTDVIFGSTGDDRLFGQQSSDKLYGEDGNDKLYGGQSDDDLFGGDGDDRIWGETGHDRIYGEAGNDTWLDGGDHNDKIFGGPGDDIIRGGDGNDLLYGQGGNDEIRAQAGNDIATDGGGGIDSCQVAPGVDTPPVNCE